MNKTANIDLSRYEEQFQVVDAHTNGEFCRIVIGGFKKPEGETMIEKKNWMEKNYNHVRTALMYHPRGHGDIYGAFLCEPINPDAHFGIIFMGAAGYLNMCDHCTIGSVTVAIEAGLVDSKEGENEIIIETPSGLIVSKATVKDGKVEDVTFRNVPSFVYKENMVAIIDDLLVPYTITFGGNFIALVDVTKIGIKVINKDVMPRLKDIGKKLRAVIKRNVIVSHPQMDINSVDLVEFYDPKSVFERANMKNVVIFRENMEDRFPYGIGTSAKLAALNKIGRIGIGEEIVCENAMGAIFKGVVKEKRKVGSYDAIVPEITGSAYLTGFGTYIIDTDDPLKYGYDLM